MPSPFDWGNRFNGFWGYRVGQWLLDRAHRTEPEYPNCRRCGQRMGLYAVGVEHPGYICANCGAIVVLKDGEWTWTRG